MTVYLWHHDTGGVIEEAMGLPVLDSTYWLPVYNSTAVDSLLRIARP